MNRYHRAYKACLQCRRRKTKCIILAEEYVAGMPCVRCRRTMRECRFSTERSAQRDKPLLSPARTCPDPETFMNIPEVMPAQQTDRTSAFEGTYLSSQRESSLQHQEPPDQTTVFLAAPDHVGSGSKEPGTEDGRKSKALTSSVLKTSVSRCNDALDVLFAAAQVEPEMPSSQPSGSGPDSSDSCWAHMNHHVTLDNDLSVQSLRIISNAPKEVRHVWKKCRFVRTGLLSVEEAVALVESFFIDMLPHAPILDGFYADHANHHQLVICEPFLCCVILTLSSRYHFFPAAGGRARSDLIHHALWESCQQVLMQLILGQERSSKSRIRTPGSIEALLLLIEWHPQALHLPNFDDLGSDNSTTPSSPEHESESAMETRSVPKWLATIISSSRQSHRMAGMLLGCAVALANELGIFQPPTDDSVTDKSSREQYFIMRRMCLAKLVYVCQQHTSARIGFTPALSQNIPHVISLVSSNAAAGFSADDQEWHTLLAARVELAQIVRSVMDVVLPSPLVINELIRSGRYVGTLDHFDSFFTGWKNKHLEGQDPGRHFREILNAEYYTIIIGTFSLAIQAVVDRASSEKPGSSRPVHLVIPPTDYRFIEAVVDGCLEIFKIVIRLAEARQLAFAPESLFVRVTMASVFLMKAMGLGVKKSKLEHSLSTLARAISGIRKNRPDNLHFGHQYAKLLNICMENLQTSFLPSTDPPGRFSKDPSMGLQLAPDDLDQPNDCQSDSMTGISTLNFANFGDLESGFDVSWFDIITNPFMEPLDIFETRGYDSLDHNLFSFW